MCKTNVQDNGSMIPRALHHPLLAGTQTLGTEASHHLLRVLRCRAGDALVLFDGQGLEAEATIARTDGGECVVEVGEPRPCERESPLQVHVIQALCLGDKMDWVVQKATELGAAAIWPLRAERSQLKLDEARAAKRQLHWQRVAESASAQSGRSRVPEVQPVAELRGVLVEFAQARGQDPGVQGLMLDPHGGTSVLQAPAARQVWVAIGPESGWSDAEEQQLIAAGFLRARLGPRILRTETVAAVVLTALAIRAGEF